MGCTVGNSVGRRLLLGRAVGKKVGVRVGPIVGTTLGSIDGAMVGMCVGSVGASDGSVEGRAVIKYCVMVRMTLLLVSAMNSTSYGSPHTATGPSRLADVANPASPSLAARPEPAKVVMTCVSLATTRT